MVHCEPRSSCDQVNDELVEIKCVVLQITTV
jgi:hypothetical protein